MLKKSIVISGVTIVIASSALLIGQNMLHFIIYEIFMALSLSFLSGSDMHILLSTTNEPIVGKKIFFKRMGNVSAAFLTGALLWINKDNYYSVIIAQVITSFITLFLCFSINYTNGHNRSDIYLNHVINLIKIFKENKKLVINFLILLISSSSFFLMVKGFQPLLKLYGIDNSYFAFLYGVFHILQGVICYKPFFKPQKFLKEFTSLGPILCLLIIYFTNNTMIMLLCFVGIIFSRSLFFFIFEDTLRKCDKHHIATYNSMFNTIANIAVGVQALLLGLLVENLSLKDSLLAIGISITIIYFLLMLVNNKDS